MIKSTTVSERQHGITFKHGVYRNSLSPGRTWLFGSGWKVKTYPKTTQWQTLANQDMMTKDGASIKVSVILMFSVDDPVLYFRSGGAGTETSLQRWEASQSPEDRVVVGLQVSMRDWISARELEQVVADRDRLVTDLGEPIGPEMAELGLKFEGLHLRDLVIGGSLRTAYSDLLRAKLEAQSALERARGESATMRSLVNTARLVRENPGLLELRILSSGQKPRLSFVVQSGAIAQAAAESEATME